MKKNAKKPVKKTSVKAKITTAANAVKAKAKSAKESRERKPFQVAANPEKKQLFMKKAREFANGNLSAFARYAMEKFIPNAKQKKELLSLTC